MSATTTPVRSALVVASYEYGDPKLRKLRAPARDAEELARVLGDPRIGDFQVDVSLNEPEYVVRRRLAAFFKNRGRDDLLLLHFSCHGLKDEDGHLYFAAPDTDVEHLDATAVASEFVNQAMARSLSRRIILLLDCCYAGAFGRGSRSRAGEGIELKERFDGRGRVVLTASNAMEYSFEGEELSGAGRPSVFTTALVEGLETGAADQDGDGRVSVDELYDFVYERVRSTTPNQTPSKWTYDVQGELYIAQSPAGVVVKRVELPAELRDAIASPLAGIREGSAHELARLLRGSDPSLAEAAREALTHLAEDDSRRVSLVAASMLEGDAVAAPAAGEPQVPAPTATRKPVAPRERAPVAAPTARRRPVPLLLLACTSAVVLLLGALSQLRGETNGQELALVTEFAAVAVGVLAVAALARRRLRASFGIGLLLGFGLEATASALGALGNAYLRATLGTPELTIIVVGAGGLLVTALLGLRALAETGGFRAKPDPGYEPRVLAPALGGAGAFVWLLAYALPYVREEGFSQSLAGAPTFGVELTYLGVFVGLLACAIACAAVYTRPTLRLLASGVLIACAFETLAFFAGLIWWVQSVFPEKQHGPAGIVGIAGAGLVAAAGLVAIRAGRAHQVPESTPVAAD